MGPDRIRATDILIGSTHSGDRNRHGSARSELGSGSSILAKRHNSARDQLGRTLHRRLDRAVVSRIALESALVENAVLASLLLSVF